MRPSSRRSLPTREEIAAERARRAKANPESFAKYQTDLAGYSREILKIEPWSGRDHPGQLEIFNDISESVRAQLAREPNKKIFRVEAGHGVGKTFGAAIIVNWFFDAFTPSVAMTTAPTKAQVEDLLWKNVKKLRPTGLAGRVFPGSARMEKAPDHFAVGRTTNDSGGRGTERFQGEHDEYQLFVLDEAEGVADFVFDAVDAMMTGGKVLLAVMLANPRTRTSRFHKLKHRSGVRSYRLSVLNHPNVVDGLDTVPGATGREWVEDKIERWCDVVDEPNVDEHTFSVGFDIKREGVSLPAGTIFKPNSEFCFRVIGVAPENSTADTFVSIGRYEAAQKLEPLTGEECVAKLGVDVARFGDDLGTLYVRHAGSIRRKASFAQQDTGGYVRVIRKECLRLFDLGVTDVQIRVDGTGGFGSGIIDSLKSDDELAEKFERFVVLEVQFGASASDSTKYADQVTEMYGEAAETLKGVRLDKPPEELEGDLTERRFEFVNRNGREVKKLEQKEKFKRDHKRSPDDGDGFVLAAAPDFIFAALHPTEVSFFRIRV